MYMHIYIYILLAIILPVLQFTTLGYAFGIFKLLCLFWSSFSIDML